MMGGSWAGGVRARAGPVDEDIEPRLCGNCSGRGRECVRSNNPHLLQSCKIIHVITQLRQRQGGGKTYHFSRAEVRSTPCRSIRSATVKTPPAHPIAQFCRRIVRKSDLSSLAPGHAAIYRVVAHVGHGRRSAPHARNRDMGWILIIGRLV